MPSPTSTARPTLWIATKNRGKTREFKLLLARWAFIRDLYSYPKLPDIKETGDTFLANAKIKAVTLSRHLCGRLILADDSGLIVPALGGHPGVRSARYAGPQSTPEKNRRKLLKKMVGLSGSGRKAYFQATLVLAKNGRILGTKSARIWGQITMLERGSGGFGYDPIFQPRGFRKTFGELPASLKKRISHRARAARAIGTLLSREINITQGKVQV
jgi:XTP/dITP diphosphohydrolase